MTASAGAVKWFGGYNSTKGVENKFGFLEGITGVDVFLHQDEWLSNEKPREGQFVYFELEEKKGKWSAGQARFLDELPCVQLVELIYNNGDLLASAIYTKIKKFIDSQLNKKLSSCNRSDIERIIELLGLQSLISLLIPERDWPTNLDFLAENGFISPLTDIKWEWLPTQYLSQHAKEIVDHLASIERAEAARLVEDTVESLPGDLQLYLLLAGYIESDIAVKTAAKKIELYAKRVYSEGRKQPDYLTQYIKDQKIHGNRIMKNPIAGPVFRYYQFKKYLFEKDFSFISLYEGSEDLQSRTDAFILKELFSLILADNTLDTVYTLFMSRLWEAISAGKIDPRTQTAEILELFPSCNSISEKLSCEAIYWKQQNKYLCRGRECRSTKVIGRTDRSYCDFTIYDWLTHYGINYKVDKQPEQHDFPIKLAAYLNRLREIFEALHCRHCSSLMLPDMKYARVEYTEIENGLPVKKDMAPAYRLTVFKCPNHKCPEYQRGHYISHCMGYDCYDIIDSRESSMKCDSGRYICRNCASCCGEHAKSNPAGFCPDCTSPLRIYESRNYDSLRNRYKRYVKCSNALCSFSIRSDDLTKRFYLPSCGPVISQDASESISEEYSPAQ
jgi:cold shock CspA family protein